MMRGIATFGFVGLLSPAPGTWGSLAALIVAYLLLLFLPPILLPVLTVALYPLGLAAAGAEIAATGDHDPSHVVIDEVVGQWVALWPVALGAALTGAEPRALWPGWIAAFLLFRLFDIAKPGVIGRADRRGDAAGLMLDDVWAGVFAAIGVSLLAALGHGVMRLL